MAVEDVTLTLAAVPLKLTAVVPVKPRPLIVTTVPTGPLVGAKLVIVGGAPLRKAFRMFAVVR